MTRAVIVRTTVRREAGPWTPAVSALLRHFEAVGFHGAPRVVGIDEEGREVLTYVEGVVPGTDPAPGDDEVVFVLGQLLRAMHDAQEGFTPPPDAQWQVLPGTLTDGQEVICHHDALGPNVVLRDRRPVALIDWELAAPGRRLTDVAAAAAWWTPLRPDTGARALGLPTDRRAERLRLISDGYGLDAAARHELVPRAARQLRGWYENFRILGGIERRPKWAEHWDSGGAEGIPKTVRWLDEQRPELERCLR